MKKSVALAALAVLVVLALAGDAQAQYRREPDWLAIGVNQIQSIVPDLLADHDRRNCESAYIYGGGSGSCGRAWRQQSLGYGYRFQYPDYGYGYGTGYGYGGGFFGNSGYSYGRGRDYRYDRYRRHGDVSNRAVRNAVAIGEGVNAGIGLVDLWLSEKDRNRTNRLLEEQNDIQLAQLRDSRRTNSGSPEPGFVPVSGPTAGIPVLNRTNGCDLVLKEADGRLTALAAGGTAFIGDPKGLQVQVLGNSACRVTGSRTADGGSIVLTCQ